jgi:CheY-like chemotaxis protein
MPAVLVVDDESTLARSLCRELSQHGYETHTSSTVEEGAELLRSRSIDVLVTDLRISEATDGMTLLERARRTSPHTRAILMSGHASARDYARAVELGAVRVLCKPFTIGELVAAVRQAVECESGFRASLHGLSIIDVLQMLHFARRPVRLMVDAPRAGWVDLRDGDVIAATCGRESGEIALAELLAQPAGVLSTAPLPEGVRRTIQRDFQHVLLDALPARAGGKTPTARGTGTVQASAAEAVARSAAPRGPAKPATQPPARRTAAGSSPATPRPSRPTLTGPAPPPAAPPIPATAPPTLAAASRPFRAQSAPPLAQRVALPLDGPAAAPPPPRDERTAARLLERGLELLRARDLDGARAAWEQALALAPDNRIVQANLRRLSQLSSDGRGEDP